MMARLTRPTWRAPLAVPVDVSPATWRARAVRYVLIYLALSLSLVGLRSVTWDIRGQLRDTQALEAQLSEQRELLSAEVDALHSMDRVRSWALAAGLRRYAEQPKELLTPTAAPQSAEQISGPPSAPVPPPGRATLEVRTQWR